MLLTFNFSLLISNCGLDVEDSTPPSPPVWIEKSLPEEWPERGIDAHESGGIFLEWELNRIEENVTSYLLYRAEFFEPNDSLGNFELLETLMLGFSSESEYIDRNSSMNTQYHYMIIAKDASENKSTPSDTLSYRRFGAVGLEWMLPNGVAMVLPYDRKVQWAFRSDIGMENYTLNILNVEDDLILRREVTPGNYIGGAEFFTIPDTIILLSGNVYKWRVDMGAQYVAGRETAGSESAWATFLYTAP